MFRRFFVCVVLAFGAFGICFMGAASADEPTLSDTTDRLTGILPKEHSVIDPTTGSTVTQAFENSFAGCTWTVVSGRWSDVGRPIPGLTLPSVSKIRFESRADSPFYTRRLTDAELASLAVRHPDHHGKYFSGHVDVINLAKIRLGSFTIMVDVPDYGFSSYLGASSEKYVFLTADDEQTVRRIGDAFQHAAILCGAKADPF